MRSEMLPAMVLTPPPGRLSALSRLPAAEPGAGLFSVNSSFAPPSGAKARAAGQCSVAAVPTPSPQAAGAPPPPATVVTAPPPEPTLRIKKFPSVVLGGPSEKHWEM